MRDKKDPVKSLFKKVEAARQDVKSGPLGKALGAVAKVAGEVERRSAGLYPFAGAAVRKGASKGQRLYLDAKKAADKKRVREPYVNEKSVQADRYEKNNLFGKGLHPARHRIKGEPEVAGPVQKKDLEGGYFSGSKVNPKQLPKTLYHTTVAKRDILKSGVIKGSGHGNTGLGPYGGAGGAERGATSLSPSRKDAMHTTRELKYLVDLARQHGKKLKDLSYAQTQHGFRPQPKGMGHSPPQTAEDRKIMWSRLYDLKKNQSWNHLDDKTSAEIHKMLDEAKILERSVKAWKKNGGDSEIKRVTNALRAERDAVQKKLKDRAKGEGWDFKPERMSTRQGVNVKSLWQDYANARVAATSRSGEISGPPGTISKAMDNPRPWAQPIKDPMFITDDATLMKIHPDDITTLKVPRKWLNARGLITKSMDVSGPEIRTYADIYLSRYPELFDKWKALK